MNKKFLSAILFGALMVSSTGTFVSCKDYDDDIDRIDKELTDLKSQIAALQSKIDAGKYITSVDKTDKGLTFTLNDGSSYEVTNGVDGEKGEKGDGNKLTIDKDGQWLIDDEPTGWYCAKKGETATVIVPEVGADGYWYFVNKETGKLEKSTYKAAPVSAVEADGICTLTVVNPDGTTTVVKLPTTAASITEIEFVGYTDANGDFHAFSATGQNMADNKYIMSYSPFYATQDYSWKWTDADETQKVEGKIAAKTAIVALEGRSLVVRVAPLSADASKLSFSLVNSKLAEAPITLGEVKAYEGLVTRAESSNGLWTIALDSKELSGLDDATALDKNFVSNNASIAFALRTSNFISNYNLTFKKDQLASVVSSLNDKELENDENGSAEAAFVTVAQGATNTFTFDNPTSVYKSQIIVDEFNKQNWGVKIEGNTFKVTEYYDKATIPAFPVYFYYEVLKQDPVNTSKTIAESVKKIVYVRLERSISDGVVLDTKNHIINAVATNDNFSAAMKPFFDSMSAEELTNWKEFVKNADVKVYQVGTNADGSDKDITAQIGSMVKFYESNGTTEVTSADKYSKIATIKVDLNNNWPTDLAFDKNYYIEVKFYDAAAVNGEVKGDVLNSVKLPFTVNIPSINDIFVQQTGVFVNGVANAYMDATAGNADLALNYALKSAFNSLKAKMGTSTFQLAMDDKDANKIGGKKHSALAKFVLAATGDQQESDLITEVSSTNIDRVNIQLIDAVKNGTPQNGYKQELIVNVKNAKFVGKYAYGTSDDVDYTFKIKIMSPLYEGVVKAVGGKVEVPATSASGYEVNDSHVKGYTYNDQVYSIFCDVAGKYDWTRKELKDVEFTSLDENIFTCEAKGKTAGAADNKGNFKAGYVVVTPKNLAETASAKMKVTVVDAWGLKKSSDIDVTVKVGK